MNPKTSQFIRQRERVMRLLKNYGDIYLGAKHGMTPITKGFISASSSVLNEQILQRIEPGPKRDGYTSLNKALVKLSNEKPSLYRAILTIYLTSDVGENEIHYVKQKAKTNQQYADLAERHDLALNWLTLWLIDTPLFVKWPDRTTHINGRHRMYEKVEQIYKTYYEGSPLKKTDCVKATLDYFNGALSEPTLWKIIKTGEEQGRLKPNIMKKRRRKTSTV